MTVKLEEIIQICDLWMNSAKVRDYCPNGLQVEGKEDVAKILLAVTASQAVIDRAIEIDADLVLVHHGYFWKGEPQQIVGSKRRRLQKLLVNNISMAAYHLPLDIHPEFGNNAQLGEKLGLTILGYHEVDGLPLIAYGELKQPLSLDEWGDTISAALGRKPLLITSPQGATKISRVAWCTGGAQGYISEALKLDVEAYLSGEVSEPTYHTVVEDGIHYVAAGHHATERYGIQALGEKLKNEFDLQVEYFELNNPV